jgi:hypothetical protein
MSFWVLAPLLAVAGLCTLLLALGRYNETLVMRDWVLILNPKASRLFTDTRADFKANVDLAGFALTKARKRAEAGFEDEAKRLLDLAYRVFASLAPTLLHLIGGMALFSRMVAAMAPTPPLRPRDFRLRGLASLAYLNAALHRFLVSTRERFRLRLYCLRHGIGFVLRYLRRSTATADWKTVTLAQQDFETLTDETLESFRAVLIGAAAEPRWARPEPIASLRRPRGET